MKLVALSPALETLAEEKKLIRLPLLKYTLFKVDQALPVAWSTLYRRHPRSNLLSSPGLKYSHQVVRKPLCPSSTFAERCLKDQSLHGTLTWLTVAPKERETIFIIVWIFGHNDQYHCV